MFADRLSGSPQYRLPTGGLPSEGQRTRGGQIHGRLDRRERLDVVLELRVAVELRERVTVIRWAVPHSTLEPSEEGAVGPFDRRAAQHRWRAVEGGDDVGHLVVRTVREGGPVPDDERGAPGIGAEHVIQPPRADVCIGAARGELVI